MGSEFFLSNAGETPIYAQIIEQVVAKVVAGDWGPGYALPSIRQLASDNAVSVITVKRAYLELERLGIIVTRQGRGSFVSEAPDVAKQVALREFEAHVDALLESAGKLGFGMEEIVERVREKAEGARQETAAAGRER